MPPKPHIWTEDAEFNLIHEVKQRPILWDVKDTNYKRTYLKNRYWDEIAQVLGPQFDAEIVKKRFTNMKDTWMDNNRKVRDSQNRCSGKGAEEIFQPRWKLFDSLSFLSKAAAQSTSFDSLAKDMPSQNLGSEIQNIQIYHDDNLNKCIDLPEDPLEIGSPMSYDNVSSPGSSTDDVGMSRPSSAPVPEHHNKKSKIEHPTIYDPRGSKISKVDLLSEALQVMKDFAKKDVAPMPKDSFDHFGSFVAARLRAADPQIRKQMEYEIFTILNRL